MESGPDLGNRNSVGVTVLRHIGVIADPVLGNGGAVVIAVLIERDCVVAAFLEERGVVACAVLAYHCQVFPAELGDVRLLRRAVLNDVSLVGVTLLLK